MSQPRSNSRRFVNAAWSLLTFQLIASAGAVAVTGVAAFHVSNLLNAQQTAVPVEEATASPAEQTPADAQAPQTLPAPADAQAPQALPAPAEAQAPSSAPAPAGPVNDGPGTLSLASDTRGNIVASLRDPDGISQGPRIQWFRNGELAPNAAGTTYSIRYEDSQAAITARAEYVDGDGFRETVASAPFQVGVIIP